MAKEKPPVSDSDLEEMITTADINDLSAPAKKPEEEKVPEVVAKKSSLSERLAGRLKGVLGGEEKTSEIVQTEVEKDAQANLPGRLDDIGERLESILKGDETLYEETFKEAERVANELKPGVVDHIYKKVDEAIKEEFESHFGEFDLDKLYGAESAEKIRDILTKKENKEHAEEMQKEFLSVINSFRNEKDKSKLIEELGKIANRTDNPNLFAKFAIDPKLSSFLENVNDVIARTVQRVVTTELTSGINPKVSWFEYGPKQVLELLIVYLAWNSAQNAITPLLQVMGLDLLARPGGYTFSTILTYLAYNDFRHGMETSGKNSKGTFEKLKTFRGQVGFIASLMLAVTSGTAIKNAATASVRNSGYAGAIESATKSVEKQINENVSTVQKFLDTLQKRQNLIVKMEKNKAEALKLAKELGIPEKDIGTSEVDGYGQKAASKDYLFEGKYDEKDLKGAFANKVAIKKFRDDLGLKDGESLSGKINDIYKELGLEVAIKSLQDEIKTLTGLKIESQKDFWDLIKQNLFHQSDDPTKLPRQVSKVLDKIKAVVEKYKEFERRSNELTTKFSNEGLKAIGATGQSINVAFPETKIDDSELSKLPQAPKFSLNVFASSPEDQEALVKFVENIIGPGYITKDNLLLVNLFFSLIYYVPENTASFIFSKVYRRRNERVEKELLGLTVEGKDGKKSKNRLEDINYREQLIANQVANMIIEVSEGIKKEVGYDMVYQENNREELIELIRYKIRKLWQESRGQSVSTGVWSGLNERANDFFVPYVPLLAEEHNSYLEFVTEMNKRMNEDRKKVVNFVQDIEPAVFEILDGFYFAKKDPKKAFTLSLPFRGSPKEKAKSHEGNFKLVKENLDQFLIDRLLAREILATDLEAKIKELASQPVSELKEEDKDRPRQAQEAIEFIKTGGDITTFERGLSEIPFLAQFKSQILKVNYASIQQEIENQKRRLGELVGLGKRELIRQIATGTIEVPSLLKNSFKEETSKKKMSAEAALLNAQFQNIEHISKYLRSENEHLADRVYYIYKEIVSDDKTVIEGENFDWVKNIGLEYDSNFKRIYLKVNGVRIVVPDVNDKNIEIDNYILALKAKLNEMHQESII